MMESGLFNSEDVAKALFEVLEDKASPVPSDFEDKYKLLAFSRAAYSFRAIIKIFLLEMKEVGASTLPHHIYLLKINGKYVSVNNRTVDEEQQRIMKEVGNSRSTSITLREVDVYHILEDSEVEQRESINLLTDYLIRHAEFFILEEKTPKLNSGVKRVSRL